MTIQSLDTHLLHFFNQTIANPVFDILMPALTFHGYLLVIPFLLAMFLQSTKQQIDQGRTFLAAAIWTLLIACCAVFMSEWLEEWMKISVGRVRPCRVIEGIRLIIPCPASYSMPSGHATSSFAFTVPLFSLTRRYVRPSWRFYPLCLAALIAFSRIYLGVHYPTDVLVGAILGSLIGLSLSAVYQIIFMKENRNE